MAALHRQVVCLLALLSLARGVVLPSAPLRAPSDLPAVSVKVYEADNELVDYVHAKGVWVRVTKLTDSPSAPQISEATNGHTNVKAVFDGDKSIVDCDVSHNRKEAVKFAESIVHALLPHATSTFEDIPKSCNASVSYLSETEGDVSTRSNMRQLRRSCQQFHKGQRRRSERQQRRREKRFINPGTQWCGTGTSATHAFDIGAAAHADHCCKEHDGCPYFIDGFDTKYNYFNYRFYTVSFCECDRKFYDCLKSANTGTANWLGKWFFNVFSKHCFDLKRQKICTERSWWGTCNRWRSSIAAEIKPTPAF